MAANSSSTIPPSSPPAGVPPVAASSMAGQLHLTGLDVNHAPPQLDPPPAPVTLKGEVIASNPDTKEVTIKTPAGEIRLTSTTPLPEGLEVSLQLYAEKTKLRATIIVMRSELARHKQLTETLPPTPAPPPAPMPLKQGQVVPAVMLPKPDAPTPLPVAEIARTLEHLRKTMPDMLRYLLPAAIADEIIHTPDMVRFLNTQPPARLRDLAAQVQQSPATSVPTSPEPDAEIPAGALTRALNAYQPQQRDLPPVPPIAPATLPNTDNALLHVKAYTPEAPKPVPPAQMPAPQPTSADIAKLWEQAATLPAPPRTAHGFQPTAAPQQDMYHMTAIKILPPATPPAQIQVAMQQAATIVAPHSLQIATVDSLTPAGQPILTTPNGSYAVRAPVTVDIGSTLIITLTPMTADDIGHFLLSDISEGAKKDTFTASPWQALKDAFAVLHQADPAAMHNLRQTLPSPSTQFTPTVLFFIAALRMGAVEKWLGDNTIRALQDTGKSNVAERLTGDFSRLSTQSKETSPDGWRSFTLPLLHDDQLSHLQMYVRQQHDGEGQHHAGTAPFTRFIVNMQLSRIGEMQLDGLLRKQKGQFDLILRTHDTLSSDMRHDLMQAFARGLSQANMQGNISFQTRQQSWVMVEADRGHGDLI